MVFVINCNNTYTFERIGSSTTNQSERAKKKDSDRRRKNKEKQKNLGKFSEWEEEKKSGPSKSTPRINKKKSTKTNKKAAGNPKKTKNTVVY